MATTTKLMGAWKLLPLLLLALVALQIGSVSADCTATTSTVALTGKSWKAYGFPTVALGRSQGWAAIPSGADVCVADLVRDFKVSSAGDTVPYWVTNDVKDSVTRAVIVFAGKNRDTWSYFGKMRNARNRAAATYPKEVKRTQVAIYAPMLFSRRDKASGSVAATDLYWAGNEWADGLAAVGPSAVASRVSSFLVIDKLIDEIKRRHPAVKEIVVAGHSAGAQLVNRYSAMKTTADVGVKISYWIGNPGSWLWMETKRPVKGKTSCPGWDDYKYGLAGTIPAYASAQYQTTGQRTGAIQRLLSRNVHVRVGQRDNGPGDVRCQAKLQGANHRERGTNYQKSIASLNGGKLPASWTFESTPGCSHDDQCMFYGNMRTIFLGKSDVGQSRRAVDDVEGLEEIANELEERIVVKDAADDAEDDEDADERVGRQTRHHRRRSSTH